MPNFEKTQNSFQIFKLIDPLKKQLRPHFQNTFVSQLDFIILTTKNVKTNKYTKQVKN